MSSLDRIDSKFTFVLAAAKRARQLQAGARPLVPTTAHKSTCMAMEEVLAGVVPYVLPGVDEEAEQAKAKKKGKRAK
ncbi:MAG: DNA-directed RNA polymerase subunit omega [Candidatus Acidoferrales bacterium]